LRKGRRHGKRTAGADLEWIASLPADVQPTALLRHYARIANVIAAVWYDNLREY
jgi:hypothetical protein